MNLEEYGNDLLSQTTSSGFSSIGLQTNKIVNDLYTRRRLQDFHPLTEEDCFALQKASGREFSLNAMNEILLDMSGKAESRTFKNKKAFMLYMAKVFTFEKRDAVKTGGESFRIKANGHDRDGTYKTNETLTNETVKKEETKEASQIVALPENLWGKIRKGLILQYGDRGKLLDQHWFSKLSESVNDQTKVITLQAPNSFIRDWIMDNCLHNIEKLAAEDGYKVELVL